MIKAFKLITLFAAITFLSSCAKEEDRSSSIPDRRVEIKINTKLEHQFDNPFYSKPYAKTGYAGVLAISNAEASWIYAYDLCCPYEAPLINEIVVLKNRIQAQCPKCKTIYDIAEGKGKVIPKSGPGTEKLKSYNVTKSGDNFIIYN